MKNVNFWYVGFLFKIIIMWFLQLGEFLVVFLLDSHFSKYLFSVGGVFCVHYMAHVEVRGQPGGVDFLLPPSGFWGSYSGHQARCRCFTSWLSRLAWLFASTPWRTMSQGDPLARLVLRLEAQPSGESRRPSARALFCSLHTNDHLPRCSFSLCKAAGRMIFSLRLVYRWNEITLSRLALGPRQKLKLAGFAFSWLQKGDFLDTVFQNRNCFGLLGK